MGTAERVIASEYDRCFISPAFRLPWEMPDATSDFFGSGAVLLRRVLLQ